MCGIVGIFDTLAKREIDRALLDTDEPVPVPSRAGRGRAAPGTRAWVWDIGGCRSSTCPSGQQPLFNEDGSVVVVFNGEIYNFPDLMRELTQRGPCLPHPLRHRGHRACLGGVGRGVRRALPRHVCVRAVGSQPRNAVPGPRPAGRQAAALCAAAGRQPAFSAPNSRRCWFIRVLSREIDPLAVEDYFAYGYVPEPRTIFKRALQAAPRPYPHRPARRRRFPSRKNTGMCRSSPERR